MLEADNLMYRLTLKKQLLRWRVGAVVLLVLLLVVLFQRSSDIGVGGNFIARIVVEDLIVDDAYRIKVLRDLRDNSHAKAVMVYVNSPGGTVVGGEGLYRVLRSIAEVKPVVAVLGSVAASGGYMTAIGADYIFSHSGTVTGSIGVMLQSVEVTDLAEKVGVSFKTFRSAPLKGVPSPFEPLTPEVEQVVNAGIQDAYNLFVDMVAARRTALSREEVLALADGRVYTGRQALEHKLIDAIGDEEDAVDWLREKYVLDIKATPVKDISLEKPLDGLESVFHKVSGGFFPLNAHVMTDVSGILAIWQPGLTFYGNN